MRLRPFVFVLASLSCLASVAALAQPPDGRAVFTAQCIACHQPDGKGVPGQFPPLAGNSDIFLARDFPARVVLFGMAGKVTVKGQTIDGAMPPLGDVLKDEEIAAVVNYVRGAFGNAALAPKGAKTMAPLDAATVAALRKVKDADQVYAYRNKLQAAAKQ
jgi:mono/diheme cytochrome c family protein